MTEEINIPTSCTEPIERFGILADGSGWEMAALAMHHTHSGSATQWRNQSGDPNRMPRADWAAVTKKSLSTIETLCDRYVYAVDAIAAGKLPGVTLAEYTEKGTGYAATKLTEELADFSHPSLTYQLYRDISIKCREAKKAAAAAKKDKDTKAIASLQADVAAGNPDKVAAATDALADLTLRLSAIANEIEKLRGENAALDMTVLTDASKTIAASIEHRAVAKRFREIERAANA